MYNNICFRSLLRYYLNKNLFFYSQAPYKTLMIIYTKFYKIFKYYSNVICITVRCTHFESLLECLILLFFIKSNKNKK